LLNGRSGIDFLRAFPNMDLPTKLAAEVRNFDPLDYIQQKKMLKVMSRDIQLGVSAASLAMSDSKLGLAGIDPDRLGVEFGAGHISITPTELAEAAAACTGNEEFEYDRWGEDSMGTRLPAVMLRRYSPWTKQSASFNAVPPTQ
jgi:3-oxoacyl-[acyl-carrier-protein] synthase II